MLQFSNYYVECSCALKNTTLQRTRLKYSRSLTNLFPRPQNTNYRLPFVLQPPTLNALRPHSPGADRNTDASGIAMSVSRDRKSKRAGVYLMSTDGYIPAKSTTFMEVACGYNGDQVIHPFAFRTHAHTHG